MNKKPSRLLENLGSIIFSLGMIIGFVILAITVWGNIEAFGFYPSYNSDSNLKSLRCPVLITSSEKAVVSVKIDNPLDRQIKPTVKSIISQGFISYVKEDSRILEIQPDESITIEWPVESNDAVYHKFIMARVNVNHSTPLEDAEAVCSIFTLNVPFSNGTTILYVLIGLYFVLSISGFLLWKNQHHAVIDSTKHKTRAYYLLFATNTIGLLAVPFRYWAISGLALISVILLAVSSLTLILYTSKNDIAVETVVDRIKGTR